MTAAPTTVLPVTVMHTGQTLIQISSQSVTDGTQQEGAVAYLVYCYSLTVQ